MEQSTISPDPQPNAQPNPALDHSLRSYFLRQGQSISRLNELLYSNIMAYGFKAFVSVAFQLFCYLLFGFAIYKAITLPNYLEIELMTDEKVSLVLRPFVKEISYFLLSMKLIICIMSLPVLICALLLGRNRRKSARIRKSFNEAELMKKDFEQALREFRF